MGTRGTIHFIDGKRTIGSLYIQYDSYPSGLGADLLKYFGQYRLCNGYGSAHDKNFANGIECLAAQVIAKLKTGIGNVYMTGSRDRQEYNYFISAARELIDLKVTRHDGKIIYKGLLSQFDPYKVGEG